MSPVAKKERLQEARGWRAGWDVDPKCLPVGAGIHAAELCAAGIYDGARLRDGKRCVQEAERMADVAVIVRGGGLTVTGDAV